ncbi:hypothetical protein [Metamycoplasma hominis]|uniref:Uncharacterized protein n=1 Tax=Metamycoplasma hominis (strain ATCC 23114 / DSM 25592 / NBRC 14850 / NCTC 10111 / PG21) TaxID=347256 RepID=D1J7L8_METH1|nr:hypothetical protein [Metamycoplasma hominis]CAX37215.1 Hypothetical protein MHO_0810 [Metamycoplasma hominis ATCC 23114]
MKKNKKQLLLFLPYWILLAGFVIYLLVSAIMLKIDGQIDQFNLFPLINQIFLIAPSYTTQLLLALLSIGLFLNFYFVKRYLSKRSIELDHKEKRRNYLIIILTTAISLIVIFLINVMILFIKQNFYEIIHRHWNTKTPVYLENTKIIEYFYVYIFRLTYWFLLSFLLIKITNNFKKAILFTFVIILIYLISLILGTLFYQISHDRLTNYLIIVLSSIVFPEILNTLFSLSSITMTLNPLCNNIYLINLVYIPTFILFIVLIAKTKEKQFIFFKKANYVKNK